jgi:hypothetical protein
MLSLLHAAAQRLDRYLSSREASVLGQTLVLCSPMFAGFFIMLLVIDLR